MAEEEEKEERGGGAVKKLPAGESFPSLNRRGSLSVWMLGRGRSCVGDAVRLTLFFASVPFNGTHTDVADADEGRKASPVFYSGGQKVQRVESCLFQEGMPFVLSRLNWFFKWASSSCYSY